MMRTRLVLSAFVVLLIVAVPGGAAAAEGPGSDAISSAWLNVPMPALVQGQQTQAQIDWQKQFDAAKARRKSGLKKVVIGLVMEGGGVAMALAGATTCANSSFTNNCSGSGAVAGTGVLITLGGAVPFWWGVIQYIGANGDVHSLEATKPTATSTQSIPLSDHQVLRLSVGLRPSVGYSVSW